MKCDTSAYVQAYNTKPKQYSHYTFEITGTDGQGAYLTERVSGIDTFTNAKRWAIRTFMQMDGRIVKVVDMKLLV